ncbi:MAG TPA: type IV pilus secretin PilQ, partial [Terriglobia bacterium]|nr:type IV pilus secretin PilQ [Terriglobia bacterium]
PPVARVVLDLDAALPYQIRTQSNGLVIALNSSASAMSSPNVSEPPARNAAAEAASNPTSVAAEPVLLASYNPAKVVAPVGRSEPPVGAMEPPSAAAAMPEEEPLPAPSQNSGPEPGFLAPAASLSPAAQATSAAASQAMPASSIAEVSTQPPVLLAQQRPAAAAAAPAMQAEQQTFTGEPISLNLKDVDLKDFFRLMHEVSGLNVVLDPNVSGVVTIVLDEVPWDQAMDVVMKNNGLEARTTGNVVRIARVSTLEAEAKAQLAKAQAEQQREELATPTQTVTRTLSYATAADLVAPLKRFLSARGDIVPDPRTNTLIVTDVPASIAKVDALLGSLDRKTPQVEIEARIIAASRSFARDIGVQLAVSGASGNVVLGGAGIVGESPIRRGTVPPLFIGTPPEGTETRFANVAQPLAVNFGAVGPTSGFSMVLTGGSRFALDSIITAAESKGLGKLLSRPKIITQNNVEGNVEQGVRIPIQTTINNTISTQYINVTLRLTVTPQITAEGTIFLKTDIENTTINPGIPRILGQPALNTQSANTQVLVSDGGTVFFGGIIQTENNLNENEVPLLGSIPLVGNLFKRRSTSTTTQELLFFITPKITQS